MPIKLYIIRHGMPLSHEKEDVNTPNSSLGRIGIKQAQLTAQQISEFGINVLYSSSMCRALDTAKPIYEKLRVPWHVWPVFCETGRRDWPKLREVQAHEETNICSGYPKEYYQLVSQLKECYKGIQITQPFEWPEEWWIPLHNETREECYLRAKNALNAIKEEYAGKECSIAIVCHNAFASVMLTLLTQGVPCDHNTFMHCHAAISRIDLYDDGTASLQFLNYFAHLYPDLVTDPDLFAI